MNKAIIILFLILLSGFIFRIPYFFHEMQDNDEGCYAGVAAIIMDGGLPYRDAVENKTPGIFYIYQLVFSIFGKYNMLAVHMFTFFWTICTAFILGILAFKLGGKSSALLVSFFYLTFTTVLYPKMIAANSEIFMVLPYSLAVLLLYYALINDKKYLFLIAGFFSGLAPLIKQVGGVEIVVVFIYLVIVIPVLQGKKAFLRSTGCFILYGIGFIVPIGIVALLFYKYGIIKDWIFWNLTYTSRYIGAGSSSQSFLSQVFTQFIPFVLSTAILWVLCFIWIKRIINDLRSQKRNFASHFSLFLILWLFFSIFVTFLGSRMFGHYFIQIIPPLVLIAAILGGNLIDNAVEAVRKKIKAAVITFTIIPGLVFAGIAIPFEATTETWGKIEPDFRPATDYIRNNTDSSDKIFVWGWFTAIYVYSQRIPSTRFVNTHMHTGYKKGNDPDEKNRSDVTWNLIPEAWPMLEHDLKKSLPELIIDTSPGNYHAFRRYPVKDYPILRQIIDNYYRFEKNIAGVDIYRLKKN